MGRPKGSFSRIPNFRLHKATGKGVITLSGVDHYCGPFDDPASRAKADRLLAEWLQRGRLSPAVTAEGITVTELVAAYWTHCQGYYTNPRTLGYTRLRLRRLRDMYGPTRAAEFGPLALRAFMDRLCQQPQEWMHKRKQTLSRTYINNHLDTIRAMFLFAVQRELVPPTHYAGLKTVRAFTAGRSPARDTDPVVPVPVAGLEKTIAVLNTVTATMVRLQLLTGMRSGELCSMRTCDITMGDDGWVYRPVKHKTQYKGKERHIFIGPAAREILRPFIRTDVAAFIFSPHDAFIADKRRHEAEQFKWLRQVLDDPSIPPGRPKVDAYCKLSGLTSAAFYKWRERMLHPGLAPDLSNFRHKGFNDCYSPATYGSVVAAACKRAGVAHWHPHQLRHNTATDLRKLDDIEGARIVLGHSSVKITQIYAERDLDRGRKLMELHG